MGNVAPAADASKFLETLKASQLLPAVEVEKLATQFGTKADPVALAKALVKASKITKWQAAQLLRGLKNFQVGNYTLQDQLGANETGRVYLAEHGKLGRKVSLKLLPKRLASDPKTVKRFLAEARIAAAIDHRAIMHVYDVDRDAEQVFIVTEYVDGVLLNKFVEQEKPDVGQAMAIFGQLIEGMAVAHEKGVIHGGLRPSTILVDQNGNIKICDLGVASLSEPGAANVEESTEIAADAITYTAPERIDSPASQASDIYAIGGVLFLLLTGEAPKSSWRSTEATKSKQVSLEVLNELRNKATAAQDSVRKLCALMLAPNPVDRPKSCRDISKGLPSLLANAKPKDAPKEKQAPAETPSATPADALTVETKSVPTITTATVSNGAANNKPQAKTLPRAKALPAAGPAAAKPANPTPAAKAATPATKKASGAPRFDIGVEPDEVAEDAPLLAEDELAAVEPAEVADEDTAGDADAGAFNFAINTAAAPAAGGFAINTSKAATPSVSTPAQKASPAVADTAAVATPAAASKLPLILGLSIGSSILALAGVVGVVMMFAGGESKKVANNPANTEATSPTETPTEALPEEGNPDGANTEEEANPGEANPPAIATNVPTTNPPVKPIPSPSPTEPETPAEPVPTEPAPAEPTPTEPAPTPTEPAPMPPAEKPPEASPPPTPTPPKPENKPPAEPFKGFALAVDLPVLDAKGAPSAEAMAEVKLGPANLGNLDCYVDLFGGQFAYKGKQQFAVEAANGGTSTTEWDVLVKAGEDGSGTSTKIARFVAKDGGFFFQWLPAAAENVTATNFRNCLISLRAGKGAHELRLRTPIVVAPLEASSAKVISGKWPMEAPPDPAHITVEILSAECTIPVVKVTPKEFKAGGELPAIWFGNTEATLPLAMQLKPTISRQFQLDGLFQYKTELEPKPVNFLLRKLQNAHAQAMQTIQQINGQLEAEKANKNAEQQKQLETLAEDAIMKQNKVAGAYEEAAKLHESLKGGFKVNFRVLYQADDGKVVEILTTKAG